MTQSYHKILKLIWERQGIKIIILPDIRFKNTKVNSELTTKTKFNIGRKKKYPKVR